MLLHGNYIIIGDSSIYVFKYYAGKKWRFPRVKNE